MPHIPDVASFGTVQPPTPTVYDIELGGIWHSGFLGTVTDKPFHMYAPAVILILRFLVKSKTETVASFRDGHGDGSIGGETLERMNALTSGRLNRLVRLPSVR